MSNIKWSKKKIVSKDWKSWRDNERKLIPHNEIDVVIYVWNEYRLIKELYGENRHYYHLAKEQSYYHKAKDKRYDYLSYLCTNESKDSSRVCKFENIKLATKHLDSYIENVVADKHIWRNPNETFVFGILT
tara:strand:- start:460 stop:852 length:393 start_codon:yes stop_codon:yes gene_type:complete